jgi:hypothetical protein
MQNIPSHGDMGVWFGGEENKRETEYANIDSGPLIKKEEILAKHSNSYL